jgi:predicted lipid-binding transport protein (Tim44 family)
MEIAMDGSVLLNLLIFGMIAVFVGLRLYNALGTKNGRERPPGADPLSPRDPTQTPPALGTDNVTPFPGRGRAIAPPADPAPVLGLNANVAEGLKAIRRIDGRFDPDQFIAGAGHAYEMIVGSFAVGDKVKLKAMLDASVYDGFAGVIDSRMAAGQTQESQFVAIHGAEIREIAVRGTIAEITVRFASDMIIATRDASGAVISGSAQVPREVIDLWTFARDLRSSDPNWLLIATGGAV